MTDLVSLPVLSVQAIAARQAFVVVDAAGSSVAATHTTAGQYVRARFFEDDVARPLALSNKPGTGTFELLVKVPDERLARLLALQKGDRVDVGPAQGKGFPVDESRGGSLWLFATGSGIAPLKAVIERVIEERGAWQEVVLVYGVREAEELCFKERFGAWAGLSVRVVPVVSQPRPPATPSAGSSSSTSDSMGGAPWSGKVGYVQHHLPARFDHPDRVTAFLCGLPEMEKAVTQGLLERGVGPDQVFRNW